MLFSFKKYLRKLLLLNVVSKSAPSYFSVTHVAFNKKYSTLIKLIRRLNVVIIILDNHKTYTTVLKTIENLFAAF